MGYLDIFEEVGKRERVAALGLPVGQLGLLRAPEAALREALQLVTAPRQVAHKVAVEARLLRNVAAVGTEY